MCQVLQVSSSGYYTWRSAPEGQRSRANRALLGKIVHIHQHSRETYGYPRVHAELKAAGEHCGRHRVARLIAPCPCVKESTTKLDKHLIAEPVLGGLHLVYHWDA